MSFNFNQTAELRITFHKTKILIITTKITSSFPSYSISVARTLVILWSPNQMYNSQNSLGPWSWRQQALPKYGNC